MSNKGWETLLICYFQKYVQDIMRDDIASLIFKLIYNDGGHLYICGDVNMASDVEMTLKEIIASEAGLTQKEADAYMSTMKVAFVKFLAKGQS